MGMHHNSCSCLLRDRISLFLCNRIHKFMLLCLSLDCMNYDNSNSLSQSGRYTISAARSCFLDDEIGSLSPGKMADFVVLSTDSWDEFAAQVSASVEATYVGGLRVYARGVKGDQY